MQKTRHEIVQGLNNILNSVENLYKEDFINLKGLTGDTNEEISELIASELLLNLKQLNSIKSIPKTESYVKESHRILNINLDDNIDEELTFAKRLTGLRLENLGHILDYQIQLKDSLEPKGIKKLDLVSFNLEKNLFYVIELKHSGNKDTLLRAILESYTYWKFTNHEKLIKDLYNGDLLPINSDTRFGISNRPNAKPAILLVLGSNPYTELEEMEYGERPKLKALSLALEISFFTMEMYVNETSL